MLFVKRFLQITLISFESPSRKRSSHSLLTISSYHTWWILSRGFLLCYCQYCFSYRALHSRHSLLSLLTIIIYHTPPRITIDKVHKVLGKSLCKLPCIFLLTNFPGCDIIENSGHGAVRGPTIIPQKSGRCQ